MSLTIPPPDELKADIRARAAELRALRKLLRLAEAAAAAEQARQARLALHPAGARGEVRRGR
jgi:hypothetical protein